MLSSNKISTLNNQSTINSFAKEVPKFDGTGFLTYKSMLTDMLKALNLDNYLKEVPRPVKPIELEEGANEVEQTTYREKLCEYEESFVKDKQGRFTVVFLIKATCDKERAKMVADVEDPHKMLEIFEEAYASKVTQNKHRLHCQVYDFKYNTSKSVFENVNSFKEVCNQLEDLGEPISNNTKLHTLLRSLPKDNDWSAYRRIWENESTLTFEGLISKLQCAELSKTLPNTSVNSGESALMVKHPKLKIKMGHRGKPYQKPYCNHCNKNGHKTEKCWHRKKVNNNFNNNYCNKCKKPGHNDNMCWFQNGKKEKDDNNFNKPLAGLCLMAFSDVDLDSLLDDMEIDENFNFTAEDEAKLLAPIKTEGSNYKADVELQTDVIPKYEETNLSQELKNPSNHKTPIWILDSGCTSHMSWDRELFISYDEKCIHQTEIMTAGGVPLGVHKVGTCRVAEDITASGVLYVPHLRHNLLSVSALVEKGFIITFGKEKAIIKKGKKILLEIPKKGSLYVLEQPITKDHNNKHNNVAYLSYEILHARLGHIGKSKLQKIENSRVKGLPEISSLQDKVNNHICESCIFGKQHRRPFPTSNTVTDVGDLIHSDLIGPLPVSKGGHIYICCFLDDKTKFCSVAVMKQKSEVISHFKYFYERSTKLKRTIKTLRSDNGGEYLNGELQEYLKEKGVNHEFTTVYTPQQNGKAERYNRTLIEMTRCILHNANIHVSWWAEAVLTANYILNVTTIVPGTTMTAYEYWTGHQPDLSTLRVFGCVAYVHIPKEHRRKLDYKSIKCIFIGYDVSRKAYRLWDPMNKRLLISRDVEFNETVPGGSLDTNNTSNSSWSALWNYSLSNSLHDNISPNTTPEVVVPSKNVSHSVSPNDNIDEYATIAYDPFYDNNAFLHHFAGLASLEYPKSFAEALASDEGEQWRIATYKEWNSLLENGTFELVELPKGRKAIGVRWIYKKKFDEKGNLKTYKARLVAKGYSQVHGIDFKETFSPVVKFTSLRILLALAAKYDFEIEQMDFDTAFLNGDLQEEIYIQQPEGFVVSGKEHMVLKLNKTLYGLKQSPREWNRKLNNFLLKIGFKRLYTDHGVYIYNKMKCIIILALYVDDLVIIGNDKESIIKLKQIISKNFKIKDLGPLKYIVGIEIIRDRANRKIMLTQRQYIKDILKRFNMSDCKEISTPLNVSMKLCKLGSAVSNTTEDKTKGPYLEAVGSIIYAMIATRPDLAFAVGLVSRYMSDPKESHWSAVKHILRYMKGTINYAICYDGNSLDPIVGYTDSDWGNDLDDAKSTSGFCFILCNGVVSWYSKKQNTVAKSTVEAEYVALSSACSEVKWIQMFLKELEFLKEIQLNDCIQTNIFCDNQGCICLSKNPTNHSRTKHVDIQYHFIRELVESKLITLKYCPTEEMIADVFTKALNRDKHLKFSNALGLQIIS